MTPQEYFDWEEKQPIKYEYMDGRVFAMTGGTILHNDTARKTVKKLLSTDHQKILPTSLQLRYHIGEPICPG